MVNGVDVGPNIFSDPAAAEAAFRPEWPGESGVRNNIIGDGMFSIDTGVSKDFSLGEQRRLEVTAGRRSMQPIPCATMCAARNHRCHSIRRSSGNITPR